MTFVRRALSQGELDVLATAHERLLTGRPGGRRLSLKFADLNGLDLSGRDLREVDFTGCALEDAKLVAARLDAAVLFCCDLRGADFSHASMVRADLRGASLRGASLMDADLTRADFREGVLAVPHATRGLAAVRHETRRGVADGATFAGATLNGSLLDGVTAFRADFSDCSMKGARLTGANLRDANLNGALLEDAAVDGANLAGAQLKGAVLTGVAVERARTERADLTGALRAPTPEALEQAGALLERALDANAWTESRGVFGAPAQFDGADLRPLGDRLRDLKMPGLSGRGACFVGMDLRGVALQGACLEDADLRGCDLRGADLRAARLSRALLHKADLRGALLEPLPLGGGRSAPVLLIGAGLRYARLEGAALAGARLDGADVSGARIDPGALDDTQRLSLAPAPAAAAGAPRKKGRRGAPSLPVGWRDGLRRPRLLALDQRLGRARADLDSTRLQRLGQFAGQLDRQQAVDQVGALHHHVVGQLEAALEVALGQTAMQEGSLAAIVVGGLAARHREQVLLHLDVQLVGLEAGDGDFDAIGVLARGLDIVGRPAVLLAGACGALQQAGQTIEADGRTVERREVIGTHVILLRISKVEPVPRFEPGPAMGIRPARPVSRRRPFRRTRSGVLAHGFGSRRTAVKGRVTPSRLHDAACPQAKPR